MSKRTNRRRFAVPTWPLCPRRAHGVHGDLSAYNLLWWEGRLVLIDLPQAVEFTTNTDEYDLLHRDLANIGDRLNQHGTAVDVEAIYAQLLALAW